MARLLLNVISGNNLPPWPGIELGSSDLQEIKFSNDIDLHDYKLGLSVTPRNDTLDIHSTILVFIRASF
jgi:hypothetical protein